MLACEHRHIILIGGASDSRKYIFVCKLYESLCTKIFSEVEGKKIMAKLLISCFKNVPRCILVTQLFNGLTGPLSLVNIVIGIQEQAEQLIEAKNITNT